MENEEKMVAYCGLICYECGAFIATKNNDDKKRKEVAEIWSKQFQADIKPEEINCEGCLSKNNIFFNHCLECEIRKCGIKRNVLNCAYCDDYVCEKLNNFLQMVPEAKKQLDKINSDL